MKKIFFIAITLVLINTQFSKAQLLIGGGLDLIKTDINAIADKIQLGVEANYFVVSQLSLTGGLEVWSETGPQIAIGFRYYPISNVFIRFRGLVLQDTDVAVGMGYSKGLTRHLRLEVMGDYYVQGGDLGVRLGLARMF
ncbi:MAG: hypothetical protein LAT68_00995 [Cyclobacteriaceae bacterium]|nr:hypothetical protein [Cyclobacteriaceae bacterium]MCH8514879.1 hypothetical protein [Cyclobacteriaceae bacterium]